jgi:phospholipid transport system substrate-binding protein
MKTDHWLPLVVLLVLIPVFSGTAWGEPPTAYVRSILDRVMAIQNDPALAGEAREAERGKRIHQIIEKSFDFSLMAQNSLGSTYQRLSAGQRQEFVETFSYLFQDSYTRMVLNFLKRETVTYNRERLEGTGARVDTTLVRTNETIPVDYLMRRQQDSWLLYDVIVDGVSILDNYKRQFAAAIQSKGFDFLLQRMKTQRRAIR